MLTEVDLGVNIDLIDPDTYALDSNGEICLTVNRHTCKVLCKQHPFQQKG